MSGTFLRWGIPALLTVVGGTAAAVFTTGAAIPRDLETRASAALALPETNWATVHFDMQDAVLSGSATSQAAVDAAIARVASVHGVREVRAEVALAEIIRPYPFIVTVTAGALGISGAFPDSEARDALLARAGTVARDDARLLGGVPDREKWLVAANYAIDQALALDEGEVALSDLDLTLSGRARSTGAYADLEQLVAEAPPAGVTVKFREIDPPLASPFAWSASFDGKVLTVSGVVPDAQFMATLEALLPADVSLKSDAKPASGAPADFTKRALVLVQNILRLQTGTASISDTTSTFAGTPADPKSAATITAALAAISADVSLEPPTIADYILSATRQGDSIVLAGYAPSAESRDRLAALPNVDASGLEIARGAPERYDEGAAFVVSAARLLGDGAVSLKGTVIDLSGRPASADDYAALQTSLNLGAPQGLLLGKTSLALPVANPYRFSATKADDGSFRFEGFLPSDLQRTALRAAVPSVTDATELADGAPAGFLDTARAGLATLNGLASGKLVFDGTSWAIDGVAADASTLASAQTAIARAGLAPQSIRLTAAEPAIPTISSYAFVATKAADGTVTLAGYVPDDTVRRAVISAAGGAVVDSTRLGLGAPDGFAKDVGTALFALGKASRGSVSLAGGQWTFDVSVQNAAERAVVETLLQSTAATGNWHVAVQAEDAAPVVTPYIWSARKSDTGSVVLSGYVPNEELRRTLAGQAGKLGQDSTLVGSGEPKDFATTASAGLAALQLLASGEVAFDGESWTVSGTVADAKAEADVATALGNPSGWTLKLALAAPVPADELAPTATADSPTPPAEPVPAATADTAAATDLPPPADATPPAQPEPAAAPEATPTIVADTPPVEALPPAEPEPAAESAPAEPAPAEPPAPDMSGPFVFSASKVAGADIALSGAVPDEPVRAQLAELAGKKSGEGLTLSDGLPGDFPAAAEAGTRLLASLADGTLGFDGTGWKLSGRAANDESRQAALGAVSALPGGPWSTSIALIPPLERCRNTVGELAGRNAILFQSGSAMLTKGSLPVLDELASDLAACPEATVNVEGHTDADGDAEVNLALSVARAEAVVNELILRGVGPERLYAVGYGETVPLASNETKAGKQANRRIAFTLADE